jgi:autotransporter-associated beta strand protein
MLIHRAFVLASAVAVLVAIPARGQLNPNSFQSIGTISTAFPTTIAFNTDTLTATVTSPSGSTTFNGVAYAQAGGPPIAVFDFASITVGSGVNGPNVTVTGSRPLAVLCQGNITNFGSPAANANGATVVAGGYLGGSAVVQNPNNSGIAVEPGAGPGGGGASFNFGAGGGGYGGQGGSGGGGSAGNVPPGGVVYGSLPQILQGGSGGGATSNSGITNFGGGGGGAIEIVATGSITMSTVHVNGAAGSGGSNGNAGGGAGGSIILAAGGTLSYGNLGASGGNGSGSAALSGGGGGGGGRIYIAGDFGSYTLGATVPNVAVGGGSSNLGNSGTGAAGVITVDNANTEIPAGRSVVLDGTPVSSVSSTSATTPNIMAYVRHNLTIDFGATVNLGMNNALYTSPGAYTANLTVSPNGAFNLNGFSQTINQLNGNDFNTFYGIIVQIPAGSTLTVGNGDGSGSYTGPNALIYGTGAFVKMGAGTQTLGGASQFFSGSTTVVGGVLALANDMALPNSTITLSGGTLNFVSPTANPVIGALAGTSDLALTGITSLTVGGNNSSTNYSGTLSGSAGLIKTGTGALTLGGTLSSGNFTGTTTLNAGALALANDLALASSTVTLSGGSLLFTTGAVNPTLGGLSASTGNLALTGINSLTVGANNSPTTFGGSFTGTAALIKAGTGTLTLNGASTQYTSQVTVAGGTLAIGNDSALSKATVTLAGGAISWVSPTVNPTFGALAGSGNLSLSGIANLVVGGNNGSTTYSGNLTGSSGTLAKVGNGVWTLTGTNTQSGQFNVFGGTVLIGSAGALAPNNSVVVALGATLDLNGYSYTMTSGTTLNEQGTLRLGGGSINAAPGAVANYGGATVMNGTIRGAGNGNQGVGGGTIMSGVTTTNNTVLSVAGAATFQNFSNGGSLNVNAVLFGTPLPVAFDGFTNQGSGSITVGAVSQVNVSDFQTYGTLTINPAVVGSGQFTEMVNSGTTPMYFNGGSRTFIGTPATANSGSPPQPTFVAGIDLHGQNAIVAGGLFVNNGFIVDSTNNGAGTATVVADYGSLVKGAGFYQNPVITQNGGRVQAGNSPGVASFGRLVFGPGGVNNYVFAIDDATGVAGPSPDAAGHVSGWGFITTLRQSVGSLATSGDFTWTATPTDKLTVAIDTLLNPTTVGTDVPGLMADFDPSHSYSWPAAHWAGNYSGPTDAATLNSSTAFDTTGFANPANGNFGWSLDSADRTLLLTYTPSAVPEPGTLALLAVAGGGWLARQRFFRRCV